MLNSLIVNFQERSRARMKKAWTLLIFSAIVLISSIAGTEYKQAPGFADITRPQDSEVLHGVVTIEGSAAHPAFVAYELSFAYDPNPTDTWFPIVDDVQTPVTDGRLGLWDTTSITDGDYQLRLYVILDNGSRLEAYARDLQVRNTTPAETQPAREESITSTATPAAATETPAPTVVPVIHSQRSGTQKVLQSLKIGAFLGSLLLLLFASYILFRKIVRSQHISPRFRKSKETTKSKQAGERRDE
jgi:hypothetical protein